MHTESIAHTHGHEHHHHSSGSLMKDLLPAIVSLALLAAGMILNKSIIFIAAFLPVGLPVMKEALEAMKDKDFFSEFTLMSIASIGAFCIGEYPEAVAVMLFYSVGETFQHRAVDRAKGNIKALLDVRPEECTVIRNNIKTTVKPAEVAPGEEVEVRAGERIPLDGTLISGSAVLDTAALTGESVPRNADKGDELLAGMIVCDAPVRIQVTRPYADSALSRILAMVQDANERKSPTELFIRRFARIYTPAVMVLAALIVALPALAGVLVSGFNYVFADWLYRGLVFLVISCPCALVISVPLGYFAGIGTASRKGVLFKGGNYIDALTKVDCIAFDKTGTLTKGEFSVVRCECADGADRREMLSIVLAAEQSSTHPVARAAVAYAVDEGVEPAALGNLRELSGRGVTAEAAGKTVLVGNGRLMNDNGISVPEAWKAACGTAVLVAVDGACVGMLELEDTVKEDAAAAISSLKNLGISRMVLLSGDRKEVAGEYARRLGIADARGGLLPEDKAKAVEQLLAEGHSVAFVGDGMNDAPVLALSDVGIAMGGLGSDAAIESADVVIQTDQPSRIADAIGISRRTKAIVKQNIVGAISIKLIILALGALGIASMWAAVFADVGVALLAVLNSLRIARWK